MSHPAYVSSPLSEAALNRARDGIAHARKSPASKDAKQHLLDTINCLTEEAMNYYFYTPMDIIKAGTMTRKFVGMGVSGSLKMVNSMGKKAISSLSEEQIIELCDFIEDLIHERSE